MNTLDFMTHELERHRRNYEMQKARNAKGEDLENIAGKIRHYEEVVRMLERCCDNSEILEGGERMSPTGTSMAQKASGMTLETERRMRMREILFRGKRIDNGEWVEGSLEITHIQPLHKKCMTSMKYVT